MNSPRPHGSPLQRQETEDKNRRDCLLTTLWFYGGTGCARDLLHDLEFTHNVVVTLDRVRADLAWLAGIGALSRTADIACLTQAGRDHAERRLELF